MNEEKLPEEIPSEPQQLQETIVAQEGQLKVLGERLAQLQQASEEQGRALELREKEALQLQDKLTLAAAKYRSLLLSGAREIPEELVVGETVEDVEASFARAREMVERVKSRLESQIEAGRIPPGAPLRGKPDLSSLSPREKIAYGLSRQ